MDAKVIKKIITNFDRNAFLEFFNELITREEPKTPKRLSDTIWASQAERFYQSEEAFFLQYIPIQVMRKININQIDISSIAHCINYYEKSKPVSPWLPIDGRTFYVINNFDSDEVGITDNTLMEYYERELKKFYPTKMPSIGVGNVNTFLNASPDGCQNVADVLRAFSETYRDGICISLSNDKIQASEYISQSEFSGVTKKTLSILQPILKLNKSSQLLQEFNEIINADSSEHQLEQFLNEYYPLIFGPNYDQISTQLWLKFPEIDIGKQSRRMDIFLRNSVKEDWELFELKKSNVGVVKKITGVPMFTSAVNDAIAQAKNYQRLLAQDKVKMSLAAEGIEYYNPEINIVIGRKPSITSQQWRCLVGGHENDVKIHTYDDLSKEASARISFTKNMLNGDYKSL